MEIVYSEEVLHYMRNFYNQLPERLRRLYAAVEARKLGHGGTIYVSKELKIDPKTVRVGFKELDGLIETVSGSRQRKVGGGRKKNF